ncbi:MAG: outer membrane protein assembly factor BamC [Candidatus Nitrotoga sp.]
MHARGNDPELEAAMLQMLAAKLGGFSPGPVADAAPITPAPAGTVVEQPIIEKQIASNAKLSETKGGEKIIVLQETFDKSWRKIGLALEQAAIEIHDKDRANGVYFLSTIKTTPPEKSWLESLAFWRADNKPKTNEPPARYQVIVRAHNATDSEVSVVDQDGRTDDTTLRIINSLFQQLSK